MCNNFATRMQEARFLPIDLVCYVFVSKVRVLRVPTDKGFPYAIALWYMCMV